MAMAVAAATVARDGRDLAVIRAAPVAIRAAVVLRAVQEQRSALQAPPVALALRAARLAAAPHLGQMPQ